MRKSCESLTNHNSFNITLGIQYHSIDFKVSVTICIIKNIGWEKYQKNFTNYQNMYYSITGISPQRYLWRIVIALHISPRLVISFVNKNHLNCILNNITNRNQLLSAKRLAKIVHYLSLIEISALAGVTYVSNKENYRKFRNKTIWTNMNTLKL